MATVLVALGQEDDGTAEHAGDRVEPGVDEEAAERDHLVPLEGDVSPVHDPVVIKERDTYYVFVTGGRNGQGVIPVRSSTDMRTWKLSGFVFESLPDWPYLASAAVLTVRTCTRVWP